MLKLPGAPALSRFRLDKLLTRLKSREPDITGLSSRYLHFIDHDGDLADAHRPILDNLLTYGPRLESGGENGQLILVLPRFGTISPWASKATDIAHICGLAAVRRVERGMAYFVASRRALPQDRLAALAPLFHDRMTESVVFDADEAMRLFEQHEPAPLEIIDVLHHGAAALAEA